MTRITGKPWIIKDNLHQSLESSHREGKRRWNIWGTTILSREREKTYGATRIESRDLVTDPRTWLLTSPMFVTNHYCSSIEDRSGSPTGPLVCVSFFSLGFDEGEGKGEYRRLSRTDTITSTPSDDPSVVSPFKMIVPSRTTSLLSSPPSLTGVRLKRLLK